MGHSLTLAVVVPSYGHFDYVFNAAHTALGADVRRVKVFVVDDASPDYHANADTGQLNEHLTRLKDLHRDDVMTVRFSENGGLTRSWNEGLKLARDLDAEYACVTNSDVRFSSDWFTAIRAVLDSGYDLVGPVTNAPGTEAPQDVSRYFDGYELKDDQDYIDKVGTRLLRFTQGVKVIPHPINGFCMVARTKTWWSGAYDRSHVFRPSNPLNSKGQRNPTPLMTLNEYELQGRWRDLGRRVGVCPGSFVFHYRAVSRGDRHKKGNWYRMPS
jgi:GT2 family glycosyltransferase